MLTWDWLRKQLWARFKGFTIAPGFYQGVYEDPDEGLPVTDESRKYEVALHPRRLDELRDLLREACGVFQQKCIYLSVRGSVEFVRAT